MAPIFNVSSIRLYAFATVLAVGGAIQYALTSYVTSYIEQENQALLKRIATGEAITVLNEAEFPVDRSSKILSDFRTERESLLQPRLTDYVRPQGAFEFIKPQVIRGAKLSPNGRYVSAIQTVRNNRSAVIFDLEKQTEPVLINFGGINVDWVSWARDDRILIGYSLLVQFEFQGFSIVFGGSRVLAVDRDGSNAVTLFDGEPSVGSNNFILSTVTHMLSGDASHILMPAFKDKKLGLWRVNIDTGNANIIQEGNSETAGWFADQNGNPALRVDSNKRGTFLRVFLRDPQGNRWRQVSSGPFNPNRTPNLWPAATGDGGGIYVLAHTESEDRVSMKFLNPEAPETLDTIFTHSMVDVSGAVTDVADGSFIGSWFVEDHYDVEFQDRSMQAHYDGLKEFFGGTANIFITSTSKEKQLFLVYVSGPQDPGDYYIYDYQRANITPLAASRPDLSRDLLSPTERIEYDAPDGVKISAYVTHPLGDRTNQKPLIVLPHGGPETRDMITFDPFVQFLASRGYRVIQPNFRGSAGFGKAFAELGYGQWGKMMQADIDAAAITAINRDWVKENQICIVGGSYGGFAALSGIVRSPDLYRCAIGIAGVYDLVEFLNSERKADGRNSAAYQYWLKAIGNPNGDRNSLKERSPINHAANISVPVMLVHGAKDAIVPVAQSQSMRDALNQSGSLVKYMEFANTGHSSWPSEVEAAYLNVVEIFLWQHLEGNEGLTIAALPGAPENWDREALSKL